MAKLSGLVNFIEKRGTVDGLVIDANNNAINTAFYEVGVICITDFYIYFVWTNYKF